MTRFITTLAATVAAGALAVPATAQNYPQPTYPQQYPQQQYQQQYQQPYQQAYPQNGYGQQGYSQNPIQSIIDSLLGNRYNVTDRQAVSRCASAALTQAQAQYGGGYNNGYGQQYGQQNAYAYNRMAGLRVTSITDVQRRSSGLRVSGTLGSGGRYGSQYGYQGQGSYQGQRYAQGYGANSFSFRCNVDYNGSVTGVRIRAADAYRG